MAVVENKSPTKVCLAFLLIALILHVAGVFNNAWLRSEEKHVKSRDRDAITGRCGLWECCTCVNIHKHFRTVEKDSSNDHDYNSYGYYYGNSYDNSYYGYSGKKYAKLPDFFLVSEILASMSIIQLWVLLAISLCFTGSRRPLLYVRVVLCCFTTMFLLVTVLVFGDQFRKDPKNNEIFDGFAYSITGPDWGMGAAIFAMLLCSCAAVANVIELHVAPSDLDGNVQLNMNTLPPNVATPSDADRNVQLNMNTLPPNVATVE